MKNISTICATCIFVFFFPYYAFSLPIIYSFAGTITKVEFVYGNYTSTSVGDEFTAILIYNYDENLTSDDHFELANGSQIIFNFGDETLFSNNFGLYVSDNAYGTGLGFGAMGFKNSNNRSYDTWVFDIELPSLTAPHNMMPPPEDLSRAIAASFYTDYGERIGSESAHVMINAELTPVDLSTPIPEPATILLLGGALIGLARYQRKQRKA